MANACLYKVEAMGNVYDVNAKNARPTDELEGRRLLKFSSDSAYSRGSAVIITNSGPSSRSSNLPDSVTFVVGMKVMACPPKQSGWVRGKLEEIFYEGSPTTYRVSYKRRNKSQVVDAECKVDE